jgi:hypothetical protein
MRRSNIWQAAFLTILVSGTVARADPMNREWTEIGMSPRTFHRMAYDSDRGRVVLFGGLGSSVYGDTWEWDGAGWTGRLHLRPGSAIRHAMVYDAARHRVLLFRRNGRNHGVPVIRGNGTERTGPCGRRPVHHRDRQRWLTTPPAAALSSSGAARITPIPGSGTATPGSRERSPVPPRDTNIRWRTMPRGSASYSSVDSPPRRSIWRQKTGSATRGSTTVRHGSSAPYLGHALGMLQRWSTTHREAESCSTVDSERAVQVDTIRGRGTVRPGRSSRRPVRRRPTDTRWRTTPLVIESSS